ncbi:MAG: response regulator [Gammaproteobacteria bacterium]|nr:response regulator [Gammaproteobacteria bacterium]MBU1777919.1 response regulator [Gammaproteobacteria bacterium]MBU1969282.1 response regulator [Gammaproteobacteria bacterium]
MSFFHEYVGWVLLLRGSINNGQDSGLTEGRPVLSLARGRNDAAARMNEMDPNKTEVTTRARILIVDGDPGNLAALGSLLQPHYDVLAAPSGELALQIAAGTPPPDLILLDVLMPGMDGYELTAAIRAAEQGARHIPIVALTANALKGEADHCRAIGMDEHLSKPVQLTELKAMLERWLPVAAESTPAEPVPAETISMDTAPPAPATIGTSKPVDVNVLKALVGDDEATIRDFLNTFRLNSKIVAAELCTACTAGQTSAAWALAHKLKSSARTVGALALGELCAKMEQAGKADNADAMAALLPKFEQEQANVEHFLEEY